MSSTVLAFGRITGRITGILVATALICGSIAACADETADPAIVPPVPASCAATNGTLCQGNVLSTCVDGVADEVDCGAMKCSFVDDGVGSQCIADPCALIGPTGVCADNALTKCDPAGTLTRTDCGDTAECRFANGEYGCFDATGTVAIRGQIKYEDRPPTGNGMLGATQLLAARAVTVVVVDEVSKQILGTVLASDNGMYVAHIAPTSNMIHVTAVAQNQTAGRPMTVKLPNNMVHGFASPSLTGAAAATVAVTVTQASGAAQAFNVFDQSINMFDALRQDLGIATVTPFTAFWARGSTEGTYYTGSTMYLPGEASDDDGYDDSVILHESGHYVEDLYGRTDSPGGAHNGTPADPNLAWSEGFATYWACAVLGQPIYTDSNAAGGFFNNIDTDVTKADATALIGQPVAEGMISEILWDLGDRQSGAADDDMVSDKTSSQVSRVQVDYLKSAQLRSVGDMGVDLVDFLDGWFKKQGLSACSGTRDIVTAKRSFPYDYKGPAGLCP